MAEPKPEIPEVPDVPVEDISKLKAELAKLKKQVKKKTIVPEDKFLVEKGQKLGNINKKDIYCKRDCPRCPLKTGNRVVAIYIKDPKTGLCIDIGCKSMNKAQ